MAFFKKTTRRRDPILTPSDIKRIREANSGGKNAEFRKCHQRVDFECKGSAPISFSYYGKSEEEVQAKAQDTLKALQKSSSKWKIARCESLLVAPFKKEAEDDVANKLQS